VVASSSRASSPAPSTSRTSSSSDYRAPAVPTDPVVNNNPSCSSGMSSIPTPVLETMISSNKSVKRCFYEEKQRTGALPGRVDVRLTIRPTGNVESARVTTAEYKGSELDACLSGVLRSITMPCFTGETMKVTYPFVL
jgi:outer membrane biosynthesis protein TonB